MLEKETGVHPGWINNGGLFIANSKQRLKEYERLMTVICFLFFTTLSQESVIKHWHIFQRILIIFLNVHKELYIC